MINVAHDGNDRGALTLVGAIGSLKDLLFEISGLLFYFHFKFSSNQRSSLPWNTLIYGSHDPIFHEAPKDICHFDSD